MQDIDGKGSQNSNFFETWQENGGLTAKLESKVKGEV
jgi:hypothetical protein